MIPPSMTRRERLDLIKAQQLFLEMLRGTQTPPPDSGPTAPTSAKPMAQAPPANAPTVLEARGLHVVPSRRAA